MTSNLEKVHSRLKELRTQTDLALRPSPFLRETCRDLHGNASPLNIRPYQVQGIFHLLAMERFVLGDDCGLGKTLETIGALCYLWESNPNQKVLVLTIKSAVEQWAGEFEKFTEGVQTFVCLGAPKQRSAVRKSFLESEGPSVLLMGYRSAVQDFTHLQRWKNYLIVFDECSVFKNPGTQVAQVCQHLAQPERAVRAWGLTATLIENNLIDGYGIYRVIVPQLFGSRTGFINRFCITRMQPIQGGRQIPVIAGYRDKDIQEFRELIDPFYYGRPKFAVAKELPPLTRRVVHVGLSRIQREKYNEALTGLLEIGNQENEVTKLTSLIYCQEIVDHPELIECEGRSEKLGVLLDMLTEGDLSGEKVIVFTRFERMVTILMRELARAKVKAVRITGPESSAQRKANQNLFQDPKSGTNVIVINTAAARAVNLQAAKVMVFYDVPWSAGMYLQILGRMIRIGSLHDRVYALSLASKGTIDDRVLKVIGKKMALIEKTIGKRIKGEEDEPPPAEEDRPTKSEIVDLFEQLTEDARSVADGR